MDEMNQKTTAELEAAQDALTKELAGRREQETAAAHFVDSDGKPFEDPVAVNDAVLRAFGGAMEKRTHEMTWMDRTPAKLGEDLQAALRAQDYVAVGCYAGMLYASELLAKNVKES